MRRAAIVIAILALAGIAAAADADKGNRLSGKKLIEWGWDEPGTRFLRDNVETMEQMPFDGLVFHADSGRGGSLTWEMWGPRKFDVAEFQHAIDDLRAARFRKFTELFLRVNVTPGNTDWFDDAAFRTVIANFALAADVARQGAVRGFMFDVEQYNEQLFDYRKQKHHAAKSFAEYQAKVRERGRQWIAAVAGRYPKITILLTFGYNITRPQAGSDRSTAGYGLLADFLDGVWEACPAGVTIVDAWESSYTYKQPEQFHKAYEAIKKTSAAWSAVPQKYARVQAGFGIWLDCNWRSAGWHVEDVAKNFFKPNEFERSVRAGLEISDKYVWIYTEEPRWWPRQKLPQAYIDALRNARNQP
jgi:hypothetical protein